jgi:hypothetical protein
VLRGALETWSDRRAKHRQRVAAEAQDGRRRIMGALCEPPGMALDLKKP